MRSATGSYLSDRSAGMPNASVVSEGPPNASVEFHAQYQRWELLLPSPSIGVRAGSSVRHADAVSDKEFIGFAVDAASIPDDSHKLSGIL